MLEKLGLEGFNGKKVDIKNTTNVQCNLALAEIGVDSSPILSQAWKLLRPILIGKILYTPDTRATQKIISLANNTFKPLVAFKTLVDTIANHDGVFQQIAEDPETVAFIRDMIMDTGSQLNNSRLMEALAQAGGEDFVDDLVKLGNGLLNELPRQGSQIDITTTKGIATTLNWIQKLAKFASKVVNCIELDRFVGFETEYDMELESLALRANDSDSAFLAGVVFVDFSTDEESDSIPPLARYKIRMDRNEGPDASSPYSTNYNRVSLKGIQPPSKYITSGFQYIQDMIERALIAAQTGRPLTEIPGSVLQVFPYPCYTVDTFNDTLAKSMGIIWTVAFIMTAMNVARFLVVEKETRLKETMKVMGLQNSVFWVAALIDGFCVFLISIFILTTILKVTF